MSGPTPNRPIRSGAVAEQQRLDLLVQVGELADRDSWTRWANEERDALVAAVTGSDDLVDRSFAASATRAVTDKPFRRESELVRGSDSQMAHLHDGLHPGLSGRALGHHQNPDGLDGTVLGLAET